MKHLANILPAKEQINDDLKKRNINAEEWWKATEEDKGLLEKYARCYSRIFSRGKTDKHLYLCGVNLRLNSYCEWLIEKYPNLKGNEKL